MSRDRTPQPPDPSVARFEPSKFGLTRQLAALILIVLTVMAAVAASAMHYVATEIIEEQTYERIEGAANSRAKLVQAYVESQVKAIELAASRTAIRRHIRQYLDGSLELEQMRAAVEPILRDAAGATPQYRGIWIVSQDGAPLVSTAPRLLDEDFSNNPTFRAGLKKPTMGLPYLQDGEYRAQVATPCLLDRRHIAVTMALLNVNDLETALTESSGVGAGGRTVVTVMQDGEAQSLLPSREESSQPPPVQLRQGGPRQMPLGGDQWFVYGVPLDAPELAGEDGMLNVLVKTAEVNQPIDELRRWLYLIVALLLAGGLLAAVWVAWQFTRPIRQITTTAVAIARGDMNARADVPSSDEVGQLALAFNEMTDRLAEMRAGLKKEVQRRTAELAASEQRYKTLVRYAPEAILVFDVGKGRFVDCNPAAEKLFKLERDELLSKHPVDLSPPRQPNNLNSDDAAAEKIMQAISGELPVFDWMHRASDGVDVPCEVRLVQLPSSDRNLVRAAITNVAWRKKIERDLQDAIDEAKAANQAKSVFLANMSHEIRTPMNGITGMAQLLEMTPLNAAQKDYLRQMQESADSLLRLLNDILDFSKIEAGKLELEEVEFGLRDAVERTVHILSLRAQEKGIELTARVAPEIPDRLVGDPGRLGQIILNLVSNAVKFTEQGEVAVNVDLEESTSESVRLRFSVRDTGVGVAPEKQHQIFQAFDQADVSTSRRYGGTGLGLTICSQLTSMMDGRVWMESEPGQGAHFHFTVALQKAPSQDAAPASLESLSGLRVLVVDDHSTSRLILEEMIAAWDMKSKAVKSGRLALEEFRRGALAGESYRLVLLDMMMPEMDGIEVVRRLRKLDGGQDCKVILLSSAADVVSLPDVKLTRQLTKPVIRSDLLAAILEAFADVSHSTEESAAPMSKTTSPRKVLLVDDNDINRRVAGGFLAMRGHLVTEAVNGRQAVEMFEQESFDAVLMDVQMPVMNGYEAAREIRRREGDDAGRIPIIAMTAEALKGDREKCLESGMNDYITKPIGRDKMIEAVEQLSSCLEGDAEAGRQELDAEEPIVDSSATPKAVQIDGDVIDWDAARENIDGGDDIVFELAAMLRDECPQMLRQIRQAIDSGDFQTLQRSAHTIKGSSSYFGADRVVKAAKRIEMMGREKRLEGVEQALEELTKETDILIEELNKRIES